MCTFIKRLLATAVVFQLLSGPAGAWLEPVKTNQLRAEHYILELKTGKDPDTVQRPEMKQAETLRAKQIRRKLINGMNEAEDLAREGKNDLIPDPSWIFEKTPEEKPSSGY